MDFAEMIYAACCEGEEEFRDWLRANDNASTEEKIAKLEEYNDIYNFSSYKIRKFENLILNGIL